MSKLYTLKNHYKESQLYFNRTVVASVIVCLTLLGLAIRLVYLQIFQHSLYTTLSLNNQVRMVPITPARGLIFDRRGVLLAENMPAFSLELTPERTPNIEATLQVIQAIMPLSEAEQQQFRKQLKCKRRNEGIPLRLKLTEEELAKFSIEKHRLPGVDIVARLIRHYPFKDSFAHALGYIGPISEKDLSEIDTANYRGSYQIGKIGLEKFYESTLHGKTGYQQIETDAKGRTVRVLSRIPPISGSDLHLSLDSHLQTAATEALKDLKGAIVAIEPSSGDVLALVSYPAFDPNLFAQGIDAQTYQDLQQSVDKPLFNRALQGQYPPGSTIKPLAALQGLEMGVINPRFTVYDPGWYQLNSAGRLYRCWIYHNKRHGHGMANLEQALAQSCDTYFFTLAHKLGVKSLHEMYTRFGLGERTHLDTTGEARGLAPSAEWKQRVYHQPWYPGDTLNIGVGQGMLQSTPLQVAQFTALLAQRGKGFKPRLVTAIDLEHQGKPSVQMPQELPPIVLQQPQHWDLVIEGMRKVVHMPGGTAYRISHQLQYQMAGKTGTVQVFNLKQNEKYETHTTKAHLRDHSWFIAFAPVENPKIAIAVLIENKYKTAGLDIARIVLDSFFNPKTAIPSAKSAPTPIVAPEEE